MKSGTVDAERFKVEGRQSVHRRKMSKGSSVLNGADGPLSSYAVEEESVVRQVNLAAAYHDHISCTKSADLCKMDGSREGRVNLPCETDHIYANCSEIKSKSHNTNAATPSNTKDLALENMQLRDMILSHLDMISQLHEELDKKNKQVYDLAEGNEKLAGRLARRERRMCLLRRRCPEEEQPTEVRIPQHNTSLSSTPVLATRYFGRKSKTIPSRALKRRYMGPPKSLPVKQPLKNESSSAESLASDTPEESSDALTILEVEMSREDRELQEEAKKSRRRRGRKPRKMTSGNADFLTTDKDYFLPERKKLPEVPTTSQIDVPLWKLKPVTSFYQMEGTENINDPVFERRHLKYELDERRRKRWDMQRLREQKASERLKFKRERDEQKRKSPSFYPDPHHIEYVEVTEQLPVLAFGHLIPLFQPCEFSVPWGCEESCVTTPMVKSKRGRPSTTTSVT